MRRSVHTFLPVVLLLLYTASSTRAQEADDSHVYGQIVTDIRVIGLETTKSYVVDRELATKVGEPFTKENEQKDYERLDRLQIFSEVKIYTSLDNDGGLVVFIEVKETFAYLPVVSISVSDENGLSIGGGLKSVNLLGRAIYLSGVARFGGETTVEIDLRDPWVAGNRIGYQAEYYHRDRDNVIHGFTETADEVYTMLRKYIGEYGRAGGRSVLPGDPERYGRQDPLIRQY